jgi:hypothetical protein
MRVFMAVCLAALFLWAAVLGLRTNADDPADATDEISISSVSKPAGARGARAPTFIELHNNAHLENLPIQSIPDPLKQ